MTGNREADSARRLGASTLARLVGIADAADDDDDDALRKRIGVVAGYITIVAPLTVPFEAGQTPVTWVVAISLSAFSAVNLVVLAHTHRFRRYVFALLLAGTVFVPVVTFLAGGLTGGSTGLGWAFLVPAYGLLALGPRAARSWFVVYLAMVAFMVIVDPVARARAAPTPYVAQISGQVVGVVVPLTITFLLLRYTDARRLAAEVRADELLTNAIPRVIATRLRRGERRIADSYPATTIVFADIVGFTPWAQRTSPHDVVGALDALFTRFDQLADRHGLEKIKTIGDAYMAVAGAPTARPDHALAAIELAKSMVVAVRDVRDSGVPLEIRVGLASGPVVGGVIGRRRLLFDLWGDTVNLASRMESSGIPGRIQVAESTRDLVGDAVSFDSRDVEVKGLGRLTAYLVA